MKLNHKRSSFNLVITILFSFLAIVFYLCKFTGTNEKVIKELKHLYQEKIKLK